MRMSDQSLFDAFAHALRNRQESAPSFALGDAARARAGLAVYRNTMRASLAKALAEKFPVVEQLVGEKFFRFAALEFLNAHPPSSPLLSDYGGAFPAFLASFEPAQSVPYLADMARLEIAWLEAYRAADATPMSAKAVAAAGADDPTRLRIRMHPSARFVRSHFPIVSIWRRCKEGAKIDIKMQKGECAMIARPRADVNVTALGAGAFAALTALSEGATVEQAFEAAASDGDFDPQAVFQILMQSGVVVAAMTDKE